jgi:deoxyribodipyrimidine photo-lyase
MLATSTSLSVLATSTSIIQIIEGGRTNALKKFKLIVKNLKSDNEKDNMNFYYNRDELDYNTTNLSAYTKFGCMSIREILSLSNAINDKEAKKMYIRQLTWRDFYYIINDELNLIQLHLTKKGEENKALRKNYEQSVNWFYIDIKNKNSSKKYIDSIIKDCHLLIQAAYNELLITGNLHNRMRMIFASYFVMELCVNKDGKVIPKSGSKSESKCYKIDWRIMEHLFATHLIDYDPIINNLNWQQMSFVGVASRPPSQYLKIEIQNKKFDPKNLYKQNFLKFSN